MAWPRSQWLKAHLVYNNVLPSQACCSTLTDPSLWILTSPGPEIFLGAAAGDAPAAAVEEEEAAEELLLPRCPFASVLQHW